MIVSWWGPGSVEDARLRPVAAAARAAGLARRAPRRAVGREDARGRRRRAPRPGRPRHPRRLRLRLDRLPRRGMGGALQGVAAGASACSHTRRSPGRRCEAASRASTRTTCSSTTAGRSGGCARARGGSGSCARRRWAPASTRTARDGRRARSRPQRRAVVRPHVAVGGQGGAGRRDDHELQRVARGNADRARSRRGRGSTRPTTARGASRARRPSARTSTERPTGSAGCGASWHPAGARDRCRDARSQ